MLASFDDAEDAVQETFLRAWRSRSGLDGGQHRAWLYRIATNVCVDGLQREIAASQGDAVLCGRAVAAALPRCAAGRARAEGAGEPEQAAVGRETIELAFLAALQVLPPRQRATLLIRDVMGPPAAETAALLETSVAAANSALQRARTIMRDHLPAERSDWRARQPSPEERALLHRFIAAHERLDAAAVAQIASANIQVTMPPYPLRYQGIDSMLGLLDRARDEGEWRLAPTAANRMPAAASYLRRPDDSQFRAFKVDVLRVSDGVIAEITTFGAAPFQALGLAAVLP